MKFAYRLWGYLLPFPMWLAELFMRTVMQVPNPQEFFPSSLAAVALGLLIPSMSPPQKGTELFGSSNVKAQRSEAIRLLAGQLLFLGTLGWLLTIYLSVGGHWPVEWPWSNADQKLWIAIALYITAIVLNEFKEHTK